MDNERNPRLAGRGKTRMLRPFVDSYCTPIYARGKVVGHVKGQSFIKRLRGSRHFLKYPPAIAFDTASLDEAEKAGATRVVVKDIETGDIYSETIEHIREWGFEIDRGFGPQVALFKKLFQIKVNHG